MVGNLAWKLLRPDIRDVVRKILSPDDHDHHDRHVRDHVITTTAITPGLTAKRPDREGGDVGVDGGDHHHDDNTTALTPLGAVADWADTVRHTHAYAWSGPLHYIDIRDDACDPPRDVVVVVHDGVEGEGVDRDEPPIDCEDYVWTRDCVDDYCVAGAIRNYTARLPSSSSSSSVGKSHPGTVDTGGGTADVPLRFVTHFIGDIHQPLHVSRTTDRGGNSISVRVDFRPEAITRRVAPTTTTRLRRGGPDTAAAATNPSATTTTHSHTNLHGVWDDILIETYQKENCHNDWIEMQDVVWDTIRKARRDGKTEENGTWHQWTQCADGGRRACLDTWAQESWGLAKGTAYVHANGTQIRSGDVLPREYYEQRIPIVLEQLAKAAVRLAVTLTVHLSESDTNVRSFEHETLLDCSLLLSTPEPTTTITTTATATTIPTSPFTLSNLQTLLPQWINKHMT